MGIKNKKRRDRGQSNRPILRVALVGFLFILLFLQLITWFSSTYGSRFVGSTPPAKMLENPWLGPLWLFTILLIVAAVVLCRVWREQEKRSLIPCVMAILSIAPALVVALTFRTVYDGVLTREGAIALSSWKMFWRYYMLIGVGLVTAVVSFLHFKGSRDARIHKENEGYKEHFVLDGDPLFKDEESTILTAPKQSKKLSKKKRKELRDKENDGN